MVNEKKKQVYEEPVIDVTEFRLEDSIASSGAGLMEELWQ